jgi:hypothetical protein
MAKSKFEPPKLGSDVDAGKFKKLAQRVEDTLAKETLFAEPKQIDPSLVLVAPLNRDGAPPNVQHVHCGILKSFKTKGFDRTRPAIGICIKFTSEEGKKKLLEHNKRFSKGNKLLPPIDEEQAIYGSLATSHFNLALRCIQSGISSPIGNLLDLTAENHNLKDMVLNGHRWWILPESVAKEKQVDISLWRNMDQNENQATHEIEILQSIKATAEHLSQKQAKVTQGDLVAAAGRRNPAKISVPALMNLCKFYIGFLENGVVDLVQDLVDFHSLTVDPKELTVSTSFFQTIVSEEALSKCPHTRLHLVISQYTTEKMRVMAGGPGVSMFLETGQITSLCRKPDLLKTLENKMREIKGKYLPILEKLLSERQARLELAVYMDLILRCLFSKPWPLLDPKVTLNVGKFSVEKIGDLGVQWARTVDLKHPDLGFAEAAGLQETLDDSVEEAKEVDLGGLRQAKRTSSDGPEPDLGPKFQRGDQVTVVRRMSWALPQPEMPKYRKDLVEGTEGVIEGWADLEQRQVLLKVVLDLPSGPKQSITKEVYPRNLKLTSDYQASKGGLESASEKEPAKECPLQAPQWFLGSSDPSCVKIEPHFKELVADSDKCSKLMYLKSRIGVAQEALLETLPKYSEKDFVVVHRKNEKGLWKDELWTKRDFEPLEIQLGPFSSQLKDTHLMATAHAVVGLPKHGRGAHPENLSLAFDGRGRTLMAHKGSLDSEEHQGSFYWLVQRTSQASVANLTFENAILEQQIKVSLPAPKRRKVTTVQWDSSELPSIPILVNKKAIQKNTKLLMFQAEKKKEEKKENKYR